MTDERDLVRSRSDIVELVGQRVLLKRVGKHYSGLCPFHDDKRPSFNVNPETGRYRCWSCDESGDVFTWVMKTESVDFPEALRILAKRAGIELTERGGAQNQSERELFQKAMEEAQAFFRAQFAESRIAKDYCAGRDLDASAVERWGLGYAPDNGEALVSRLKRAGLSLTVCRDLFLVDQNKSGGYFDKFRSRLTFPIVDEQGHLVGFGGRAIGDVQPKYLNSSDTPLYRKSRVLYGLRQAREAIMKDRKAVLVEGYMDVIACHSSGVTSAVASLGTALAEDQVKLLQRFADQVTILYDQDAAGQKAAERALAMLEGVGLRARVAELPSGEDPDTLLRSQGPEAVVRAVKEAISPIAFRLATLEQKLDPNDDEFWLAAVAILSTAPESMERGRHLLRLAGKYPHIPDIRVAEKHLAKMVDRERASKQPQAAPRRAVIASEQLPRSTLQKAEMIVFAAILEPEFQSFAWVAMRKSELFATSDALRLAASIREAFPNSPPVGPPVEWIHRVEPEEMRNVLSDISTRLGDTPMKEKLVEDSIKSLETEALRRDFRRMRAGDLSQQERKELLDRIRFLTPGAGASEEGTDDPFA